MNTNSNHTKGPRGGEGAMAMARETSEPISMGAVIEAVQALPDMDEELVLDACDFLENERNAEIFTALDVKFRRKWLLRKLRLQMKICVKQVNRHGGDKEFSVKVLSTDAIEDVKAKIQAKVRIAPRYQLLTFQGRSLEDGVTLADCGVRRGSELHMSFHIPGLKL